MRTVRGFLFIAVIAAMALVSGPGTYAGGGETCFGHLLPEFNQVFVKLFHDTVNLMDMGQMEEAAKALTQKERTAIGDYLGDEGMARVKEGLPEEKTAFLLENYQKGEGISEAEYRALYPDIFTKISKILTLEQLNKSLSLLTAEEVAAQSFYLGEEGRAKMFSQIGDAKTKAIMDYCDDWVLLETGKRKYKSIAQYTSKLYKQERVDGDLQGVETIMLKFREKPPSIYAKWIDGPFTGREALYNEAIFGKEKARFRESGILGVLPITLDVDSELARRGTNHLITEFGLIYLLGMIETDYVKAAPRGDVKRVNHGIVELDGHKVYKMESILPRDKSKGYYCYRMMHYIDYIRSLEIKVEIYNWDDQLYESYYYTDIKINSGLSDKDFDPENPDYGL